MVDIVVFLVCVYRGNSLQKSKKKRKASSAVVSGEDRKKTNFTANKLTSNDAQSTKGALMQFVDNASPDQSLDMLLFCV